MSDIRHKLGKFSEIPLGEFRKYSIGGKAVMVLNLDGRPKAYIDKCPHMGGVMRFDGKRLKCAMHGALFDAESGMGKSAPVEEGAKLTSVKLVLDGDDMSCDLPEEVSFNWSDEL